ncbi:hypothetical protein [Parapedobacter indicus]|uniref:HTH cro/C1-type domain-containing protein n=1 Tax=Parapedobacter indicus TaxID=1477437 RepID=A0A1I3E083_9SPHI|nr:hypothetical protein [Parapedobacter indicus]PPL04905.1 hypothetical protein CLV26_101715 [Parapedobacter indicus]SFH92091.1 hypothetical protein SAMN05444682_101701 [Parapedobacter indicus]
MSLNTRIQHLIDIKAGGNKTRFAALLDYSPQHLNNILNGVVGLTVVERILRAFPDVDARWLILGEGSPIVANPEVRKELYSRVSQLIELDGYLPYMSSQDIERYRKAIGNGAEISFSAQQLHEWKKAIEKSKVNAKR